jgi:hypothetical protein
LEKLDVGNGLRSGFHECWKAYADFSDEDFQKPSILNLWDFRRKDEFIAEKKYFLTDINRADIEPKAKPKLKEAVAGLSRIDRQALQLEYATKKEPSFYFDKQGLKAVMQTWRYPLHFIDFETTTVAIPFNKGRRPYEQIAFQFSHHIVQKDGTISHADQWLNTSRGMFPNYEFVRALKSSLEVDNGTIFRYAAHENTVLNAIYDQLIESTEQDKYELCDWIKSITKSTSKTVEKWEGTRNMVDMRDLVLKYYFDPITVGSNSIKDVLPAVLSSSNFLRQKYTLPIYGNAVTSLNFKEHTWITYDNGGNVVNPYKLLPLIHSGFSNEDLDDFLIDEENGIADGGAAMIAYAKMQFAEMTTDEFDHVCKALLRYCELDTFAMVLIWEAWNEWCKNYIYA